MKYFVYMLWGQYFLVVFFEKLFRTAQNKIFRWEQSKQKEEREKILNSLMQSQKRVKNYGGFYRVESSKKLWRFLLNKKLWRFLHSIEPSSSPPPPHPQHPNLFIFAMVGFLRVDGRGFCWQISSDPHYIWLLHRSQYTLLRAI